MHLFSLIIEEVREILFAFHHFEQSHLFAEQCFRESSDPFSHQSSCILSNFPHIEYFNLLVQVKVICSPELFEGVSEDVLSLDNQGD
jgi:hypothetical protein